MAKNKVRKIVPRSPSERLQTVNETKMQCIDHELTGDLATKILFQMLDNYQRDGTTYIDKELNLNLRHHTPRKFVVNLYNDRSRKDTVVIKALTDSEMDLAMATQSRILTKRNINAPDEASESESGSKSESKSESKSKSESESESDTEAPDLVSG